eukprot:Amastigsp_a3466_72.p2 type:complete len:118 gc:universal Amastigsp_a3466_72:356-3(-)
MCAARTAERTFMSSIRSTGPKTSSAPIEPPAQPPATQITASKRIPSTTISAATAAARSLELTPPVRTMLCAALALARKSTLTTFQRCSPPWKCPTTASPSWPAPPNTITLRAAMSCG